MLKPQHPGANLQPSTCARARCPALRHLPADAAAIPHRLRKARAVNWGGLAAYLFFIAAFAFYVYARAAHTLGLGPMLW